MWSKMTCGVDQEEKNLVDKPITYLRQIMLIQNRIESMHPASTGQEVFVRIYPKIYIHVRAENPAILHTDEY